MFNISYYPLTYRLINTPLTHYFVYLLPLFMSLLTWYFLNIQQPQWFIWSALSVAHVKPQQAINKLKKRLTGLSIGVTAGLIFIVLTTPAHHSFYILVFSYLGIILSLRAFKHYIIAFAVRCFFIILFANNLYVLAGSFRIIDVISGGIIGLTGTFLLHYLSKKPL